MTGGHFPTPGALSGLDACVKLDDVVHTKFDRNCNRAIKYVKVASPVRRGTNRRVAGGDMAKSQLIARAGQRIQSSHILPLASTGNSQIEVERRLPVGIWSTGTEHTRGDASIVDVNGPYLQAACAEYGVEPEFLGYLDNDAEIVAEPFEQRSKSRRGHRWAAWESRQRASASSSFHSCGCWKDVGWRNACSPSLPWWGELLLAIMMNDTLAAGVSSPRNLKIAACGQGTSPRGAYCEGSVEESDDILNGVGREEFLRLEAANAYYGGPKRASPQRLNSAARRPCRRVAMIRGTQAALLFRLDMGATGRGPCVRPGIGISTITTTNTRSRSGFSYTTASRADARENVKPRFQCGSSAIGLPRCSPVASRCQPECPVSDVGALALKRALGGHPVRVAALTSARAVDLRCTNPASRPRRIMSAAVLAARVMQWPASDARLGPTPMSKGPPIAGWRRDRRRGNGRDANGRAHWKDQHDDSIPANGTVMPRETVNAASRATDRTLGTTELLERILLQLDMRTLLVSAMRVSRAWNSLITTSPPLQRVLFLLPEGRGDASISDTVFNPLLARHFPPFFTPVYDIGCPFPIQSLEPDEGCYDYLFDDISYNGMRNFKSLPLYKRSIANDDFDDEYEEASEAKCRENNPYLRECASWRNMFTSQPPVRTIGFCMLSTGGVNTVTTSQMVHIQRSSSGNNEEYTNASASATHESEA
ncbi:hypothetical protein PCL_08598 [Purpureocillium lilacinum]|uniref:Uncharacterized protein n=1 Tax=Purpureocillium lilacinum TaxID=33203 RepID=A0A2U3DR43_PURLI|nr:hypothetical protein PCL_08598 [Purpureocillium lilacinum]